jgi:hypothetical protein
MFYEAMQDSEHAQREDLVSIRHRISKISGHSIQLSTTRQKKPAVGSISSIRSTKYLRKIFSNIVC